MQIKKISPENLIEYSFNNRNHSDDQIDLIANSIKEFGFNQPIVVDEDNIILVGHGRLKAAKKLGLTEVPYLQILGLDETKKKAYRILDNKIQNDSTWNFESLNIELPALEADGFDLEAWGLDELLLEAQPEIEVSDDEFEPTEHTETYIKLGDLIELGKHRLLCGDSTKSDDVDILMQGQKAKLVFTDPPYDILDQVAYAKAIKSYSQDAHIFIMHDDRGLVDYLRGSTLEFKQFFVCDFVFSSPRGNDPYLQHILVCHETNGKPISHEIKNDGFGSLLRIKYRGTLEEERSHDHQKSLELIAKFISHYSKDNDQVLDLFLGSGTTLIVAEQLNRICYGMELEPKYCQIILERYKKYCDDNNKKFECKINGEVFEPPVLN